MSGSNFLKWSIIYKGDSTYLPHMCAAVAQEVEWVVYLKFKTF